MATERARVMICRLVRGEDWEKGGADGQRAERQFARAVFDRKVVAGGWTPEDRPKETTEFDDDSGGVFLRVSAPCTREVA